MNDTELFIKSLKAHAKYSNKFVPYLNIDFYQSTINNIVDVLDTTGYQPLYRIQTLLLKLRFNKESEPYTFSIFTNQRKYSILAYDHALEIVKLLQKRFYGNSTYQNR